MPTVAEIVDYVCDVASWNAATGSTERVSVLGFVNQAWMDAIETTDNFVSIMEDSSEALISGQYAYDIDTDFGFAFGSTWPQRILGISVTGNGLTKMVLEQVSLSQMRQLRDAYDSTTGTPQYWCMADSRQLLLYPTPNTSFSLYMDFVKYAPTLAEDATSNEYISEHIPPRYHRTLLGSRAVAMCYEMDGVEEKADLWHSKADRVLEEYQGHVNMQGGVVQPVQTSFLRKRIRRNTSDRSRDWG